MPGVQRHPIFAHRLDVGGGGRRHGRQAMCALHAGRFLRARVECVVSATTRSSVVKSIPPKVPDADDDAIALSRPAARCVLCRHASAGLRAPGRQRVCRHFASNQGQRAYAAPGRGRSDGSLDMPWETTTARGEADQSGRYGVRARPASTTKRQNRAFEARRPSRPRLRTEPGDDAAVNRSGGWA